MFEHSVRLNYRLQLFSHHHLNIRSISQHFLTTLSPLNSYSYVAIVSPFEGILLKQQLNVPTIKDKSMITKQIMKHKQFE